MTEYNKMLRTVCRQNACRLYDRETLEKVRVHLYYELARVVAIPGGAEAFIRTAEYLEQIKNLYRAIRKTELQYTFRGPAISGVITYLMGITDIDPVCKGFYSWAFFIKRNKIEFNINLSMDTCNLIYGYDMFPPECVIIHPDKDLTELERSEVIGGEGYGDVDDPESRDDAVFMFFDRFRRTGDYGLLEGLNDFNKEYVPDIEEIMDYLLETDNLPRDLKQLMKLNGFIHSRLSHGTYLDVLKKIEPSRLYYELISCPEDIFERLIKSGLSFEAAVRVAKTVQREDESISSIDTEMILSGCGSGYYERLSGVDHLYYRSQLYEKSCVTADLMRTKEFRQPFRKNYEKNQI